MDAYTNFALGAVLTPPSPATSGTALTLASGHGARLPAPPFNATVWPVAALPDPTNAEIVRVTAIAGDVLTITRAQESTTARSIVAGDWLAATLTKKTLDDLVAAGSAPRIGALGLLIDGAGAAITTGVKGFLSVPFAGTITGWTLLSTDGSATAGSIVIDVWKDTYANYPPVVGDSITASAKPTLSSVNKNASTTLTGWTTSIAAGDVLGFKVDSAATVTRVVLSLTVQAT